MTKNVAHIKSVEVESHVVLGWRVRDKRTEQYVLQTDTADLNVFASENHGPLRSYPEALRLLARWFDSGYKGKIVRVVRRAS